MGCCGGGYVSSGYAWDLSRSGVGKELGDLSEVSRLIFVGERIGSEAYRAADGTRYLFGANPFHREHMMPGGHAVELLGRFPHLFRPEGVAGEDGLDEPAIVDDALVDGAAAVQVAVAGADVGPDVSGSGTGDPPFDFSQVKGIGPTMSRTLHEAGILVAADFVEVEMVQLKRILHKGEARVLEMIEAVKGYLAEDGDVAD